MEADRTTGRMPGPTREPGRRGDDFEQVWRRAGWGARRTWGAESRDGDRLALSLRLPLDWRTASLTDPVGEEPPSSPREALAAWAGLSGAITAQRLALLLPRTDAPAFPLLATMIATLGAVEGAPAEALAGDGARPVVTLSGLCGVRLRAVRELTEAAAPLSVLVVQYLLETPHGGLAVAFSAPQAPFHVKLERLFDQVAQTIQLDPSSAP
jgi:hypothetical protein